MGMFGDIYLFSMSVVHLLRPEEKIKRLCSSLKLAQNILSSIFTQDYNDNYNASPFLP